MSWATPAQARPLPRRSVMHLFMFTVLPPLLLVGAPVTVLLATDRTVEPGVQSALAILAALPLVTPFLLRLVGREWDPLLLSPAWVLSALGLAVIARVQPELVTTQLLWISLGWAAFITIVGFPAALDWLRIYRAWWLGLAILLAIATLFLGDDVTGQGARLWLRVGPVTVQPAEILRVVLIAFLASYFAEHRDLLLTTWRRVRDVSLPPPAYWLPLLGMVGLTLLVVMAQRDFGPAAIYTASFLGMLYLATGRKSYVAIAVGIFALGALAAYAGSDRVQGRVDAWLDPWADPQGVGYQSLQAVGAFVFGGVTGTGPGYGYPGLIPAAHTDYPLAVVGEEWGLVGSLAIVMLYGLLVARGIVRAQFAETRFEQLLGAGLALSLGVQVLVVSAGVLRLFPLTGITSPFLSYGGSSMLMAWVILALLTRVGSRPTPAFRVPLDGVATRMQPVGLALLAGFLVIAGTLGYWHVLRADLAGDPAVGGERLRLEAIRVERGRLLDRNGEVLAETVLGPDGQPRRLYHLPEAVHVLGFDSPRFGAAGAEAEVADTLMGRTVPTPLDTLRDILHEPREGSDVTMTIDANLQQAAAAAMGDSPGAVVAIDPRTGDILAMLSNPGFNPQFSEEEWEALRRHPDSPLLNRATQGLYTPGSTFKTVTLAAAVEAGLDAEDPAECVEQVFIGGVSITSHNEPPGKTTQDVADAYAYSCNTYFAELGLEIGEDAFRLMARSLGLDSAVPFALPTSKGRLATTSGFLDTDPGLAASAFGQGELQLTPLHLALVTAAVANDGVVMRPRLFLHEPQEEWRRAMSTETARQVAAMMEHGVVDGWAATAAIPGVRVAGKTGSAEVAEGESSHALFIAFAPVEDPTIAVAVVKEFAGAGSLQAGPVAQAVMQAWLSRSASPTTAR